MFAPDDTVDRLAELVRDPAAKWLVVLSDIVHKALALALPALEPLLHDLCRRLGGVCQLSVGLGNHDLRLGERLWDWPLPIIWQPQIRLDAHLLRHGTP